MLSSFDSNHDRQFKGIVDQIVSSSQLDVDQMEASIM
jgi:hypothetical protein